MIHLPTVLGAGVFGLGGTELIVILIILLVLFGGSKLPSLARGLGQSMKEFRKASKEEEEEKPADSKKSGDSSGKHGTN